MLLSTWAFAGTLLKQNIVDLAKMFGYEPKNSVVVSNQQRASAIPDGPPPLPPSNRPDIQRAVQRIKQQATSRPEEVKDPRAMASQNQQTPDGGPPPGPPAGTGRSGPYSGGKDGEPGRASPLEGLFPGQDKLKELTSVPWKEFRRKLWSTWKPRSEPPPRGCVFVTGLVELESSTATAVVDVYSWFDPKLKGFDGRHVILTIRIIQQKQQRPLRR